jgi:hypothetical protein
MLGAGLEGAKLGTEEGIILGAVVAVARALGLFDGTRLGAVVVVGATLGTEEGIVLGAVVAVGGALGLVDGTRLGAVVVVGA